MRSYLLTPLLACLLLASRSPLSAQPANATLTSTDTHRFIAAHGRAAVIMGYAQSGLEVWAYPFQLVSNYHLGFRTAGSTTEVDGRLLLLRILSTPASVTRIYAGPDFVIREKLFVPLHQPAAIITYQVESQHPVDIVVHFTPVLDLMWPGAIGGQSVQWNDSDSAYELAATHPDTTAILASPDTIAHDEIGNDTSTSERTLALTLRPHPAGSSKTTATLVMALQSTPTKHDYPSIQSLLRQQSQLEQDANAAMLTGALHVTTPDTNTNDAIAWSQIALEQAWVCNPLIGCGEVAGYGPSRPGRRPQYDWFFAGDGLVATNAFIAEGNYQRARDELLFITKYQDSKSGMIWHELSQSAGYIDWSKYPYMYVHVDITFDYLATMARYIHWSGDQQFARDHWASIAAAYAYCRSLIDTSDHLPHIPPGKEGGDEQHRPSDALSLSASWVSASEAYAALATAAGHAGEAEAALALSSLARQSINTLYWDTQHNYWIDGHTSKDAPIFTRSSGPISVFDLNLFSASQRSQALDDLASTSFQTDWGTRSVATDSTIYDPWSYSGGSVSILHTAEVADTYFNQHRPLVGAALWQSMLPLFTLDSLGHLHEVIAGNYYRPQSESVPEQTWSSAGFLDATIHGLLGISIDGSRNGFTFAPRLPLAWKTVSIGNIALPHSRLSLSMNQDLASVSFGITNEGTPALVELDPSLPLGADNLSATCNQRRVSVQLQNYPEEEAADLRFTAPHGASHCSISFRGGVRISPDQTAPLAGDPSTAIRLEGATLSGRKLTIRAATTSTGAKSFYLQTAWKPIISGAALLQQIDTDLYKVTLENHASGDPATYSPTNLDIIFR